MADQDTPARSSTMEKAEGEREPEAQYHSTVDNGGIGSGVEEDPR